MELVLIVLGGSLFLELLLFLPFVWRAYYARTIVTTFATGSIIFATVGLLMNTVNTAAICITGVAIYKIINLLRVIEGRMNLRYMYNVVLRTSISLALAQTLLFGGWWVVGHMSISLGTWLSGLVIVQIAAGVILLASTVRRLKHTQLTLTDRAIPSSELPNVTVAIPARNETDDLYDCLVSLLKNNYPKLEILVLDDCSQLRRTPEIIREFAHAGVRFVKGDVPKENWLAKNQAYDKLLREASGEIILFCGVDVRFEPDTIKQIITTLVSRNKRMVSVLPLRKNSSNVQYAVVQAARYFWELAPPRRLFRRPPILSTCWAMYRNDLLKLGGFGAVSRAIIPEAYFAKQMLAKDGYSFLRANNILQLFSVKNDQAQRSTAVRTRYPQLHRRPETVLAVFFVGLLCFIAPYLIIVWGFFEGLPWYLAVGSFVSILLSNTAYTFIAIATKVNSWYIAPFCFIWVVCTDMVLTHYSLYKYEFSEVIWKGRNVCLPVMHVIPRLPKL